MFHVMRWRVVAAVAGLTALTGCEAMSAGQTARQTGAPLASAPGGSSVSAASTMSPGTSKAARPAPTPARSPACQQAGTYLTAIRTGEQAGLDRVVFQFAGPLPAYNVTEEKAVYTDPKGVQVPLAGQAVLRVVFHGATAWCPLTDSTTDTGPSTIAPFYPRLLDVAAAGDFEHVLSFGVGLAAKGSYRAYTLTGPNRVVLDVSHVALAKFPGIWDITSWRQYWQSQYSWASGHRSWLSNPPSVVRAWARGKWGTTPAIREVNANTFQVTEPGGRMDTVKGTRPVPVPGPWVITAITEGAGHA